MTTETEPRHREDTREESTAREWGRHFATQVDRLYPAHGPREPDQDEHPRHGRSKLGIARVVADLDALEELLKFAADLPAQALGLGYRDPPHLKARGGEKMMDLLEIPRDHEDHDLIMEIFRRTELNFSQSGDVTGALHITPIVAMDAPTLTEGDRPSPEDNLRTQEIETQNARRKRIAALDAGKMAIASGQRTLDDLSQVAMKFTNLGREETATLLRRARQSYLLASGACQSEVIVAQARVQDDRDIGSGLRNTLSTE